MRATASGNSAKRTAVADSVAAARTVIETLDRRRGGQGTRRPVLTCWLGETTAAPARRLLAERGLPIILSSLIVILHIRAGGPAAAAVIGSSALGLLGAGLGLAAVHLAAVPWGSWAALGLGLA